MNAPCPLCAAPSPTRFVRHGHDIHRCSVCDMEFVHPVPDATHLAALYGDAYFAGEGFGYVDYFGAERAVADAKARTRCDHLAALGAGPRWLDVGCADGRFVLEGVRRGFDAYGVEPSPVARAAADPVVRGRVWDSLENATGMFDVVTLWDALEHLPRPIDTLRALRNVLLPGGVLAVVVPVIDNANARWAPRTWDQYKPPEHLWFFSRRSLRATLEREIHAVTCFEAPAWERPARVSDVALGAPRWIQRMEGALWRSAERHGWIDRAPCIDSWEIIVRRT